MSTIDLEDTIAAIASGAEPAPRGAIRISGSDALECVRTCFEFSATNMANSLDGLTSATAFEGRIKLDVPFEAIDCRLYLWPNNRSYTRQPSAEFHMIGSLPILNAALRKICLSGARLAEPGEFTMRAFMAGRLDLTQAEAVLGVIDARDQDELNVALSQLSGGLAKPLSHLRTSLINLLAHLEAGLDFADEDIEFISVMELCESLCQIQRAIRSLCAKMSDRDSGDQIPVVALFGWPNTGKSSLFNALQHSEQAIVSDVVGTTRDYLEKAISLGDLKCRLVDTAGVELETSAADIQAIAQDLGKLKTSRADLKLFCIDASRGLNAWEQQQISEVDDSTLVVLTKTDLEISADAAQMVRLDQVVETSSLNQAGLENLRRRLAVRISELNKSSHTVVLETALRSADSLKRSADAIQRAISVAEKNLGEELVAAELRVALEEIGRVVGAIYTDDILDRVFSQFCIGK